MSFKDEVNFCINFLKIQNSSSAEKSCIFSPISILNSLAMIYAASDGKTADQIAAIIGKDKNNDEIINYYSNSIKRHKTNEAVKSSDAIQVKSNVTSFKLIEANKLFVDKRIEILDSFNKIITEKFDGNFQYVNFKEDKDDAVKAMKSFVNEHTNGLIKEICDVEDIKDETEIILLNATHFIGRWATPFNNRKKRKFYSKIPREINLMSKTMYCNYSEGEDWKCIGIPYKERKVWMFILLPNERDGLQNLINKMDYSMFIECTKGEVEVVELTIPVFEITTDMDLQKDFTKLGITDIFNSSKCNFSKMVDKKSDGRNSCIDKAIQKAFIKVDEYGTEAAAITREDRVPGCKPTYFKADHPFIYFIASLDGKNKVITDLDQQEPPTEILFAGIFC